MEEKGKSLIKVLTEHNGAESYTHDDKGQLLLSTGYYLHDDGKYYSYPKRTSYRHQIDD